MSDLCQFAAEAAAVKRGNKMTILLLGSGEAVQQARSCIRNYILASSYDNILIKYCSDLESLQDPGFSFDLLLLELSRQGSKPSEEALELLVGTVRTNNASTVVLTDMDDCPVEALSLHIIDRVSTDNIETGLCRVLNSYYEEYHAECNLFHYNVCKGQRIVNKKQILFLQSDGRRVIIHTQFGQDHFYGKLSDCLKQPCMRDFIFIHQSYLINPFYIDEIRNKKVYIGRWELPISRKYSHNISALISKCRI